MTKVLILNVGWSNKGNRALVDSTIAAIKSSIPNAVFTLMGPEERTINGYKIKKQTCGALSVAQPQQTLITLSCILKCIIINVSRKLEIDIPISESSPIYEFSANDIIIHSGGDHLSGEYGLSTLSSFIRIFCADLLGKPVVLYGDSLGYFKSPTLNRVARFVLNRTNLILLREGLTKEYLDKNGINMPKIIVTADPAFLLTPLSRTDVPELLLKECIEINELRRPIIGINPSGLIGRYKGESLSTAEKEINLVMAKTIDHLVNTYNASIILLPHVYTDGVDDRIPISQIYELVENKTHVKPVLSEYSPQELKAIIGICDLFIGARMHAAIASTSMLVPTIGIAYSHKMRGIIGDMLGQKKYVISIDELDYENLSSKIYEAWTNKDRIKGELSDIIPIIKEKAMLNGQLVKELFESQRKSPRQCADSSVN